MIETIRAVLFSLLLCPGGGHLYLRRWWRASLFMVPFILAVGYYVYYTVDNTIDVINMVLDEEIEPEQKVIEDVLRDRLWRDPSTSLKVDRILLLVIWLAAAVDVYFLSRRLSDFDSDSDSDLDSAKPI
jgi:hypothetical protein